ncbi:nitrate- and nitrite sensing domain-containing protein [Egibacter rhizosphaerae]|nr:nitrate- and nitrite sensing domain-containing protein [Egibacter rhizosphaerae]
MIQNLRMRWKLVALLVAPLVGLLVFAGLHVFERWQAVEQSETAAELAATAQGVDDVLAALQLERRASGAAAAVDVTAGAYVALEDARTETDEAFERVRDADTTDAAVLDRLEGNAGELEETREAVTRSPMSRAEGEQAYQEMVDGVLATQRFVGSELAGEGLDRVDASLARDLQGLVALSVASESVSRELLSLEAVARDGDDASLVGYAAHAGTARTAEEDALASLGPSVRNELEELFDTRAGARSDSLRDRVLLGGRLDPDVVDPGAAEDFETRADALRTATSRTAESALDAATEHAENATQEGVTAAGAALGVVGIALLLSISITRQMERPISQLVEAAEDVADRRLPELVAALHTGRPVAPEATTPIEGGEAKDEIGRLAQAFERVRTVAADTATDLAETARRGVSELFVNLARRNQSLVDRQISVLDRLERHEEDPEALERLFTIDHLATRMRRNAESLLVMAGSETPRRWTKALPLEEVLQAAAGEVEDYRRVQVRTTAEVEIHGRAAADLAHLLAELVENATTYSDPSSEVEVVAHLAAVDDAEHAGVRVEIRDRGVGMSPEELRRANARLHDPPTAGFGVGRSLGFVVAGLLAQRHDIRVQVDGGEDGTTAAVVVPPPLLAVDEPVPELPAALPGPAPPEPDRGPLGSMQVRGGALLPGMALDPTPYPAAPEPQVNEPREPETPIQPFAAGQHPTARQPDAVSRAEDAEHRHATASRPEDAEHPHATASRPEDTNHAEAAETHSGLPRRHPNSDSSAGATDLASPPAADTPPPDPDPWAEPADEEAAMPNAPGRRAATAEESVDTGPRRPFWRRVLGRRPKPAPAPQMGTGWSIPASGAARPTLSAAVPDAPPHPESSVSEPIAHPDIGGPAPFAQAPGAPLPSVTREAPEHTSAPDRGPRAPSADGGDQPVGDDHDAAAGADDGPPTEPPAQPAAAPMPPAQPAAAPMPPTQPTDPRAGVASSPPGGELPRRQPGRAAPAPEGGRRGGLLSDADIEEDDPRDVLSRYISSIRRAREEGEAGAQGELEDGGGDRP